MKILLCDSDPSSRTEITRLLEMVEGVRQVEMCASGADAIERLEREPFDALMLDTDLPVLDGFETVGVIRQAEHLRGLPVVLVTRDRSRDSVLRGLDLAVTDYVLKPVRRRRLIAALTAIAARMRRGQMQAPPAPREEEPSPTRVLLVDGDDDFREAITRILAPHVIVSAAASGGAALNDAWDERPTLVLIGDNVGPIGPGSLARYLRQLGGCTIVKLAGTGDSPSTPHEAYAGEIARTTDPGTLLRELGRFVTLPVTPARRLIDTLMAQLPDLQDLIGRCGADVFQARLTEDAEVCEPGNTDIIGAHALVQLTLGSLSLRLSIQCTTDLIRHLAAGAGPDEDLHSSVGILGDIAVGIARAIQRTAAEQGIACEHGQPWFAPGASARDGLPADAERMVVEMAPTRSEGRFRVVLDVYGSSDESEAHR